VVTNNVRKQVNNVTFFRNKLKSRETFANFISYSDFRHVLDLIKHKKNHKFTSKFPWTFAPQSSCEAVASLARHCYVYFLSTIGMVLCIVEQSVWRPRMECGTAQCVLTRTLRRPSSVLCV